MSSSSSARARSALTTTDPYTCNIVPNGDEVGLQTLRAVVTDNAAQTAEVAVPVTVEKFDADALSIEMAKDRLTKKKVQRTISGEIDLPNNVTAEDGCDGGTVTLTVERNSLTVFPARRSRCRTTAPTPSSSPSRRRRAGASRTTSRRPSVATTYSTQSTKPKGSTDDVR